MVAEFYLSNFFYSNSTVKLLRALFFFFQSLLFGKNAHWERELEGLSYWKKDSHGFVLQRMGIRIFASMVIYHTNASVACEVTVVGIFVQIKDLESIRKTMLVYKLLSGYWGYSNCWKQKPTTRFTNPVLNFILYLL